MFEPQLIESYFLEDIAVNIYTTEREDKVAVMCRKNDVELNFTARVYEYKHYNRLMKARIRDYFRNR